MWKAWELRMVPSSGDISGDSIALVLLLWCSTKLLLRLLINFIFFYLMLCNFLINKLFILINHRAFGRICSVAEAITSPDILWTQWGCTKYPVPLLYPTSLPLSATFHFACALYSVNSAAFICLLFSHLWILLLFLHLIQPLSLSFFRTIHKTHLFLANS